MKVYIGKPTTRLVCNIHLKYMEGKYKYTWPDEQSFFEKALEKIEDGVQAVYDVVNRYTFDRIPTFKYVKIDKWDTWSMDYTLAEIVVPMLTKLKAEKHGAPYVDMFDVPEELWPTDSPTNGVDNTHFDRWDYILDEMIFAFASKLRDWEDDYRGDWVPGPDGGVAGGYFEWEDKEGLKDHQARIAHGFMLFGKYYENLWD